MGTIDINNVISEINGKLTSEKEVIKIIIAGGRKFTDYFLLEETCDAIINGIDCQVEIVSGKAPSGADKLGCDYAHRKKIDVNPYPANWLDFSEPCVKKYNSRGNPYNAMAGFKRNERMAQVSDVLIAFWDGYSPGTEDMINRAKKHNLIIHIVRY